MVTAEPKGGAEIAVAVETDRLSACVRELNHLSNTAMHELPLDVRRSHINTQQYQRWPTRTDNADWGTDKNSYILLKMSSISFVLKHPKIEFNLMSVHRFVLS